MHNNVRIVSRFLAARQRSALISEKDGGSAVNSQALFFFCSISAADNSIIGNILHDNEVSADYLSRLNTNLTRIG